MSLKPFSRRSFFVIPETSRRKAMSATLFMLSCTSIIVLAAFSAKTLACLGRARTSEASLDNAIPRPPLLGRFLAFDFPRRLAGGHRRWSHCDHQLLRLFQLSLHSDLLHG